MSGQPRRDRPAVAGLPWAFVAALALVSVNLRAPFVAVAPISAELRGDLGVSAASVGVLTSLPVLCFSLFAPMGLVIARRIGADNAVVLCLCAVVVGSVVRSSGSFALAVLGTLVLGVGITVGNIVVPVLIRREASPRRAGLVTGVFVSAINIGSMLVSIGTAPLAGLLGWRVALAGWSVLALVGIGAWQIFRQHRAGGEPEVVAIARQGEAPGVRQVAPWRRSFAWLLALAFAGQATSYYALTAWLPTLLHDEIGLGRDAAGAASSVFQICALIGALGAPLLMLRCPAWVAIAVVGVLWMAFPALLLAAPHAYLVGAVLGGIAQGGGLSTLFTIVVHASTSGRDSAQLSAFMQGVGYVVAALGPAALGLAHDATDAWTVPVVIVLATTATFTVLGVLSGLGQRGQPGRPGRPVVG